ncbi:uncharacterized protein LOC135091116 [Scylla paramamosain]|uniref:uncharacterized protein LOC135091116 n=1 Tax=Scylla paramamosain TaxID=85552 RepID=UPI00308346A1
MRRNFAVWAAVVVVMASRCGATGREPRLTAEEREAAMRRLERKSRDVPLCTPQNAAEESKLMPPLPSSFITNLELTHQEEGKLKVMYGAEAFDRILNKGVLRYELSEGIILTRPHDKQEIIHYNLVNNESLIITTDTSCEDEGQGNCDPKKNCRAESVRAMQKEMKDIFGLGPVNGQTGYYGINGILRWPLSLSYEYRGNIQCRGMLCDLFEICMQSEGSMALISYYWSLPNWKVDGNKDQVPLAIEVVSTDKLEPYFTRAVKQRYDFYEFYSNIRPDIDSLEPPADVYCKRRKSQEDPPKNPRFFSYSSETVIPITLSLPVGDGQTGDFEFTTAFTHDGYYDWESKIVTLDYVPWYILGQEYRYELETKEVQEFNQGLTYYMYRHLGTCFIQPIENITSAGDVVVSNNGTVSLLPPWMFEDLDGPWQYNGIHMMRGVEANVWVGQKDLIGFLLHENYVEYYASPLVIDEPIFMEDQPRAAQKFVAPEVWVTPGDLKPGDKVELDKVPMRLERYLNIIAGKPHLINNIFDYQTQPPHTQSIDISPCYPDNAKMRHFLLELPPDSLKQVKGLEDNLLHAAQMAMSEVAVISPLRINREMLDVRDGKTFILFTILPLPAIVGDSPGAKEESDLDTAAQLIISAVDSSKLMIVVHLDGIIASVEPVYVILPAQSIKEVTRNKDNSYVVTTDKGYSSGDMAGLAFGMLILAALLGAGIGVAIQGRSEGQGGLPRVNLARKSNVTATNSISISSDMTVSDI